MLFGNRIPTYLIIQLSKQKVDELVLSTTTVFSIRSNDEQSRNSLLQLSSNQENRI